MNLKTLTARTAVLKALRDAIDAELTASRADVLDGLLDARDSLGVKAVDVTLPDGTKVATVTLTEPKARIAVTNEDAFVAYVAQRWPTEVETTTVTKTVVRPAWQKKLLERLTAAGDGDAADTETGELVDGVTAYPPARPSSFSLRYADEGRDRIAAAYRAGDLGALADLGTTPAIEEPK